MSALGGGNGVGSNSKQLTQADDELTPVAKGKVAYYLAENLQKFYRTVGHQDTKARATKSPENTSSDIIYSISSSIDSRSSTGRRELRHTSIQYGLGSSPCKTAQRGGRGAGSNEEPDVAVDINEKS